MRRGRVPGKEGLPADPDLASKGSATDLALQCRSRWRARTGTPAIGRGLAVNPGHVAADGRVAVTVLVRRGGILSLVAPIPPATISFHGTAVVHPAGSPQARSLLNDLGSLVPAERRASASVLEITPVGAFRTFGIDVSLRAMLNPAAAQARVPVTPDEDTL